MEVKTEKWLHSDTLERLISADSLLEDLRSDREIARIKGNVVSGVVLDRVIRKVEAAPTLGYLNLTETIFGGVR